jgi:hypothetical protein
MWLYKKVQDTPFSVFLNNVNGRFWKKHEIDITLWHLL